MSENEPAPHVGSGADKSSRYRRARLPLMCRPPGNSRARPVMTRALSGIEIDRYIETHRGLLHVRRESRKRLGAADHRQRLGIERRMARRCRRAGCQHLAAAADAKAHAGSALLAGGFGSRRILLEALQMRGDALACRKRPPQRLAPALTAEAAWRLTFGAWRRGGARRRRRLGRLLGFRCEPCFGLSGVGFASGTILAGSGFGGVGSASVRAGPRLPASAAAGSARSAPDRLLLRGSAAARRRPAASSGPARYPSGSAAATRCRRHVHHDRGHRHARRRPLRVPGHAKRDHRGMQRDDRSCRRAPARAPVVVGGIVQRERVHGVSFGRRARPARSSDSRRCAAGS